MLFKLPEKNLDQLIARLEEGFAAVLEPSGLLLAEDVMDQAYCYCSGSCVGGCDGSCSGDCSGSCSTSCRGGAW